MKIHQRTCKNNFLDDKNKLLDEVSESNNIITTATENNMNKISIALFEEYENNIWHTSIWFAGKKNIFCLPLNRAGKHFVDELTKLIGCWVLNSSSSTTALKRLMLLPNLVLQRFQ